jgi:cyclic peptide transporter
VVNSTLFTGLLVLINQKVTDGQFMIFPEHEEMLLGALLILSIIVNKICQTYVIKLTNSTAYSFEVQLLKHLRYLPFKAFEELGKQMVYSAFVDSRTLSQLPQFLINFLNSIVTIATGLVFVFWITPEAATGIVLVIAVLLIIYLTRNRLIEQKLNTVRDLQDEFYKYLRDLLLGFKEVKMSTKRADSLFDDFLLRNRLRTKDLTINTSVGYLHNDLLGRYSWYLVIAVILFALPLYIDLTSTEVIISVIIVLYLMGPVAILINSLPFYTRVRIAMQRINNLKKDIDNSVSDRSTSNEYQRMTFEKIEFRDVAFTYNNKFEDGFCLGPLYLSFKAGEITFITGGNGSGKSTFINLLTGLCLADKGSLVYNDIEVNEQTIEWYKNHISVVFSEPYLFNENYDGFQISPDSKEVRRLVELLKMDDVAKYEVNGTFNTNLSKGQRKRLALIYALLEVKDIIVLDEWAADQDPEFKKYFYNDVLLWLKQQGKTIIAVTHDDNYFNRADRVITFDYGKVRSDRLQPKR